MTATRLSLILLAGGIGLFSLAGCNKPKKVATCGDLARHVTEILKTEAKGQEDEKSAKLTAAVALAKIHQACESSPWKIKTRECLQRAESSGDIRQCGDDGARALGIFDGIAKVKGVRGGRTFNFETGTWWVDGKDTHRAD